MCVCVCVCVSDRPAVSGGTQSPPRTAATCKGFLHQVTAHAFHSIHKYILTGKALQPVCEHLCHFRTIHFNQVICF